MHDATVFVSGILMGVVGVYGCVILICWKFWK